MGELGVAQPVSAEPNEHLAYLQGIDRADLGEPDRRLIAAGLVVASLICLWFAIHGILSGVVFAPTRGLTIRLHRDREPVLFWTCVWFYIGASVCLLYGAWSTAFGP
jgi:hypothetical protein